MQLDNSLNFYNEIKGSDQKCNTNFIGLFRLQSVLGFIEVAIRWLFSQILYAYFDNDIVMAIF